MATNENHGMDETLPKFNVPPITKLWTVKLPTVPDVPIEPSDMAKAYKAFAEHIKSEVTKALGIPNEFFAPPPKGVLSGKVESKIILPPAFVLFATEPERAPWPSDLPRALDEHFGDTNPRTAEFRDERRDQVH